jgi:hypothetical protein
MNAPNTVRFDSVTDANSFNHQPSHLNIFSKADYNRKKKI